MAILLPACEKVSYTFGSYFLLAAPTPPFAPILCIASTN